jgi:predicted SAM-dependent methyltransferase
MRKYTYLHRYEDGTVSSHVFPFKPGDKIIELGGGETGLRNYDNAINVDIRDVEGVDIVRDLEEDFSDLGPCDVVYASYVAEHISWHKIEQFFKCCHAILKDGGVAVFIVPDTLGQIKKILEDEDNIDLDASCLLFGSQAHKDEVHKTFFSRSFITELLTEAGFDEINIFDHPNVGSTDIIVEAYKTVGKRVTHPRRAEGTQTKINFGSFTVTFGYGWINADIREDIKIAVEAKGHVFEYCDVREPLRWKNDSVDLITAHHLMEHLTREEGKFFLGECYRILKTNGVIRLSVPDLNTLALHLINGKFKNTFDNENVSSEGAEDDADAFFRMITDGHKTMFTTKSLENIMVKAGFREIGIMEAGMSRSTQIANETTDSFPSHSFYIEAYKLSHSPKSIRQIEKTIKTGKPIITVEDELQPYQKYLRG